MADTDANTTVASDEPEKKGVGFIGGAAALGAGALAATGTGSLMHKKAVEGMAAEGKETLSKATSEGVAAYKKANPKPPLGATAERTTWVEGLRSNVDKAIAPHEEKLGKLVESVKKLDNVENSNFLKKGAVVFKEGSMKVKGIVLAAGVAATLLAGYVVKTIRNASHAERLDQERAAAAQATGPAMG